MSRTAALFRAVHIVLGFYLLFVIGYVYFCGFTGRRDVLLWVCIASLVIEGVVLAAWRGRCPVTLIQESHGDDKGFFGLFLPRRIWPFVIPFFTVVSILGILMVALSFLLLRSPLVQSNSVWH